MVRHLRSQGVSAWEVAAQLGHKSREYRMTELHAPFDPCCLENAIGTIDDYFGNLHVGQPILFLQKSLILL